MRRATDEALAATCVNTARGNPDLEQARTTIGTDFRFAAIAVIGPPRMHFRSRPDAVSRQASNCGERTTGADVKKMLARKVALLRTVLATVFRG